MGKEAEVRKDLPGSTIISLGDFGGALGGILSSNTKGVLVLIICVLTAMVIFIFYIVKYYMCHYYIKKYDLADAINIIEEAPEDSRVG